MWNPIPTSEVKNLVTDSGMMQPNMYRENLQRNAIFYSDQFVKKSKAEKIWKSAQINFDIHSASKSTIAADENNIYVGSDASWFYCYDKLTGQLIWKFYLTDASRGIHSTAIVDRDAVYVGSYRGTVYKLNKLTGQLMWARIIGHTIGASPFIDGETILFNVETSEPDGYLIKLNILTGETIWQSEKLGEQSHSSPALSVDKKMVVIGANNSTIQGFNFSTGEKKWSTSVIGPIKSTIWIDENVGYVSTWGKQLIKFNIENGNIIWSEKLNLKSQVSPALSKKYGIVMIADQGGVMYGFDQKLGRSVWKNVQSVDSQISSPVVIKNKNDELFLFNCKLYKMCLLHPKTGQIINEFDIDGRFTGSPVVNNNMMYLSMNNGSVLSYKVK